MALLNISIRCTASSTCQWRLLTYLHSTENQNKVKFSTSVKSHGDNKDGSEEVLKKHVVPEQVIQNVRAFTGKYLDKHRKGIYKCVVCKEDLFTSDTEYKSGSGCYSFYDVIDESKVDLIHNSSYDTWDCGMIETDVVCSKCDSNLGRFYDENISHRHSKKTYLIDSESLDFTETENDFKQKVQKEKMLRLFNRYMTRDLKNIGVVARRCLATGPIDFPDMGPSIPEYQKKVGEKLEVKRSRLLYQSRKRGMSENGLLLSNFAGRFLNTFDSTQLEEFDNLINKPTNDWDLFYWILEKDVTPDEFDTPVMDMLKEYCKNEEMESRYQQPELEQN